MLNRSVQTNYAAFKHSHTKSQLKLLFPTIIIIKISLTNTYSDSQNSFFIMFPFTGFAWQSAK